MIDALIENLNQEQEEERLKRNTCVADIDTAEDKEKEIKVTLQEITGNVDELKEEVQTEKTEISSMETKIKTVEQRTEEITELRQEEHSSTVQVLTQETAAINLLKYAESRLLKFYSEKEYHKGGSISCPSFSQQTDEFAADEPSSTGYAKKSESVTVVVTLIHKLTVEFEKEISVAKLSEGKAQSAYEETVKINQERSHEYEVMVAAEQERTGKRPRVSKITDIRLQLAG